MQVLWALYPDLQSHLDFGLKNLKLCKLNPFKINYLNNYCSKIQLFLIIFEFKNFNYVNL